MSIFFAPDDTTPGTSLRYSDLESKASAYREHSLMVATIDAACYGDYDNSCAVERSNYRVLLADKEIAPHLIQLHGSYGSTGLAYIVPDPAHPEDIGALPDALRDALAGLADSACLDDEDVSNLETELESEAWESWGRRDFVKALVTLLDLVDDDEGVEAGHEHASDYLDDNRAIVDALWRAGCDAYNVNGGSGFQVESGGGVHFYINEWISDAVRHPNLAAEHAARYLLDWADVPTLAELTVKCRVASGVA